MRRLLVMVHDDLRRRPFAEALEPQLDGWSVDVTGTVEDAIAALGEHPYDVLAADARIPGFEDPILLRLARERFPAVARIAFTDSAAEGDGLRLAQVAHRCIDGVIGLEELANLVQRTRRLVDILEDPVVRRLVTGTVNLASPPETYLRLRQAMANPDVEATDLGKIIQNDPAMSAKILQLVNSSFFGRTHRATRVNDAVAYLGVKPLAGIVTTMSISSSFEGTPLAESGVLEGFQTHGVLVSTSVNHILAGHPDAPDGATAGLLHDVGKLILAADDLDAWMGTLDEIGRSGLSSYEVEMERYGTTHAEVGAALLELWGLPSAIVEAVAYHHHPARGGWAFGLAGAVHIADAIVHELTDAEARRRAAELVNHGYLEGAGVLHQLDGWAAGLARRLEV